MNSAALAEGSCSWHQSKTHGRLGRAWEDDHRRHGQVGCVGGLLTGGLLLGHVCGSSCLCSLQGVGHNTSYYFLFSFLSHFSPSISSPLRKLLSPYLLLPIFYFSLYLYFGFCRNHAIDFWCFQVHISWQKWVPPLKVQDRVFFPSNSLAFA